MRISSIFLALGILLAFSACKRPQPKPIEDPSIEKPMNMDEQGRDESLGVKTLKGKLNTTKGHQAMLEGVMLPSALFGDDHQAAHKRIHELEGKTLKVRGEVIRHWCGPLEQCLSQGYIDRIKDVDIFEIAD